MTANNPDLLHPGNLLCSPPPSSHQPISPSSYQAASSAAPTPHHSRETPHQHQNSTHAISGGEPHFALPQRFSYLCPASPKLVQP
eukprot:CAMPEP_0172037706 /NCGR_PEP_ID=MMETSP1041-20130122/22902_1 /TAXON_ID=464988 /ORGANISM="Hemiselmis andersenii, Strain CCMP439" /LENGTH=84 /DNA_ID=CAMNT_0012695143 /DNA_START=278 /DNA_END=532 /DNA_ORIENTATION=-